MKLIVMYLEALGLKYDERQQYADAERTYRHALALDERFFDSTSPEVVPALDIWRATVFLNATPANQRSCTGVHS